MQGIGRPRAIRILPLGMQPVGDVRKEDVYGSGSNVCGDSTLVCGACLKHFGLQRVSFPHREKFFFQHRRALQRLSMRILSVLLEHRQKFVNASIHAIFVEQTKVSLCQRDGCFVYI